jgi:hypothetical protein
LKPSNLAAILMIAGSLLIWVEILAKPLGVPEGLGVAALFIGVGCFFASNVILKRAGQQQAQAAVPQPNLARMRKIQFWALTGALVFGSLMTLPLLPYTVENFHPWIYWFVVPAQVIMVVAVVFLLRRKLFPKGEEPPLNR